VNFESGQTVFLRASTLQNTRFLRGKYGVNWFLSVPFQVKIKKSRKRSMIG